MSAELDLSPPEVPEPTFLESLLRYGLFLGAIFQLICILAVIFPSSKGYEHVGRHQRKERRGGDLSPFYKSVFHSLYQYIRCYCAPQLGFGDVFGLGLNEGKETSI